MSLTLLPEPTNRAECTAFLADVDEMIADVNRRIAMLDTAFPNEAVRLSKSQAFSELEELINAKSFVERKQTELKRLEFDEAVDRARERLANLEAEIAGLMPAYQDAKTKYDAAAGEVARLNAAIAEARDRVRSCEGNRSRSVIAAVPSASFAQHVLASARRSASGSIVIDGQRIAGISTLDAEALSRYASSSDAARRHIYNAVASLPVDQSPAGAAGVR
jgi:septal ring factor EnvC (AmiA/AmiB activator)